MATKGEEEQNSETLRQVWEEKGVSHRIITSFSDY